MMATLSCKNCSAIEFSLCRPQRYRAREGSITAGNFRPRIQAVLAFRDPAFRDPGSLPRAGLAYSDWEPREGNATMAEPGVVF